MSKPKIPKGWRKLREGTWILDGDKSLQDDGRWCKTMMAGCKVGWDRPILPICIYIRRIRKAARSLQKGEEK